MNDIERYEYEFGKVLRTFDVERFKRFIEKNKTLYDPYMYLMAKDKPNWWFEGVMAKSILNRHDMGIKEQMRAKAILDALGWDYNIF